MRRLKLTALALALLCCCTACQSRAQREQAAAEAALCAYDCALQQLPGLSGFSYTTDTTYTAPVGTPDGPGNVTVTQSSRCALRLRGGLVMEQSTVWTETVTTSSPVAHDAVTYTRTRHTHQNGANVYTLSDSYAKQTTTTPKPLDSDLPVELDGMRFPLRDALGQRAVLAEGRIVAAPHSFVVDYTEITVDSIVIDLLEDGKIDSVQVQGTYRSTEGTAPSARFGFTWRATSYTASKIERLDERTDLFPVK